MRIIQSIDTSLTNEVGDVYITNGIATLVTFIKENDSGNEITLMIHGKSEIKLPFLYNSIEPTKIGLDASGNISLTFDGPVIGILYPCAIDDNGTVISKNAGDLHGCFWFGSCH